MFICDKLDTFSCWKQVANEEEFGTIKRGRCGKRNTCYSQPISLSRSKLVLNWQFHGQINSSMQTSSLEILFYLSSASQDVLSNLMM